MSIYEAFTASLDAAYETFAETLAARYEDVVADAYAARVDLMDATADALALLGTEKVAA